MRQHDWNKTIAIISGATLTGLAMYMTGKVAWIWFFLLLLCFM